LVNDQRDAQFFSMYLFIFLTLFTFRAHRTHYQERKIVSIQTLVVVTVCRWPCGVQVGSETSDLHTTRPPTHSDKYQRLYLHDLSFLMMSTMCSKHGESLKY